MKIAVVLLEFGKITVLSFQSMTAAFRVNTANRSMAELPLVSQLNHIITGNVASLVLLTVTILLIVAGCVSVGAGWVRIASRKRKSFGIALPSMIACGSSRPRWMECVSGWASESTVYTCSLLQKKLYNLLLTKQQEKFTDIHWNNVIVVTAIYLLSQQKNWNLLWQ